MLHTLLCSLHSNSSARHTHVLHVCVDARRQCRRGFVNAQGRPLHCSGHTFETGVSTTCEILNLSTQKYDPFPSLPIDAFAAGNPHGLAVQLVR